MNKYSKQKLNRRNKNIPVCINYRKYSILFKKI